jgi:asparagine synthase (glutamine-hydrolysing)
MIPTYLLARTVSRHCKVVLGGDGGDELFGGYRSYQSVLRRDQLQRSLPAFVRMAIAGAARSLPNGAKGRNSLMALEGTMAESIAQSAVWTDASAFAGTSPWLAAHFTGQPPKSWRRDLVENARGLPGAAMAADFRSYLPEDILVKVDRAAMLCSLEVRAPFLDQRVIEFAYQRVPNRLRANASERKILLKSLARQLLPPELDIDRKQGFTIPISKWLTPNVVTQWSEECREQIAAILSAEALRHLVAPRRNLAAEHGLFAAMLLTSWMRQYRISL